MNYLSVSNYDIPYMITKKKNKNTYFYFRKEGYIQINLSRYQSKKMVLDYIRINSSKFIKKLNNSTVQTIDSSMKFLYLGSVYDICIEKRDTILIHPKSGIVHTPTSDLNSPIIKDFYKTEILSIINQLVSKHMSNPYVDISNVTYQARYTSTRHGSCNTKKRRINLNLNLVKYDPKFIEYVLLHEIAHLKIQNHGPNFYDLLLKLCPNYKELRKEFKKKYR